ncbi:zf-TFIIB domain-containing protein [Pedobacter gandavensis]|uniref:TFIIB-type zinc ribbon-containing protein n=1 Tax=Pedobacter gandavensis TaxID=2679963 RepID=UPI00292F02CE|nr:zf-TFIIB domain-containing protein [Pedobacter gandavensis]
MNCPNCQETLLMTVRNNVEIDYCPKCRGIWLDRGELDKLLAHEADKGSSNKDSRAFRQDDQEKSYRHEGYRQEGYRGQDQRQHDSGYPKKKKSFLEDLFDF